MTDQRLVAGASGYSFKEWKGNFYPEKMKPEEMLAWYSARLPTVEINNTFYQMPKVPVLENWAKTTPENFRFSIKASRRITHMARLKPTATDSVNFLYTTWAALGEKRGPVLFQLPPMLKLISRLTEFLRVLPLGTARRSSFGTTAGSPTMSTQRSRTRARHYASRTRRQRAAADGRDGAVGLRSASDRNLFRRRAQQWATKLAASVERGICYFMHEPTAPVYAKALMKFSVSS